MNQRSARVQQLLDTAKILGIVGGGAFVVGIAVGLYASIRARAARYRAE